jgi:hypothetical protein
MSKDEDVQRLAAHVVERLGDSDELLDFLWALEYAPTVFRRAAIEGARKHRDWVVTSLITKGKLP